MILMPIEVVARLVPTVAIAHNRIPGRNCLILIRKARIFVHQPRILVCDNRSLIISVDPLSPRHSGSIILLLNIRPVIPVLTRVQVLLRLHVVLNFRTPLNVNVAPGVHIALCLYVLLLRHPGAVLSSNRRLVRMFFVFVLVRSMDNLRQGQAETKTYR